MSPHRITATSGFWEHQLTDTRDLDTAKPEAGAFAAKALPFRTKLPLDTLDAYMAEQMSVWLRKHGRALKPKLTAEQGRQLQQCFRLMDADGSGAIGSDELSSAFKLLGIKARKSAINKMIADAGADESGEVGYEAFVAMMEPILSAKDAPTSGTAKVQPIVKSRSVVSFETTINEYRRKKIIEALYGRDTQVIGMLSATPGTTDARPPAVKPVDIVSANHPGFDVERSNSTSSDIVATALKEQKALLQGTASPQQSHHPPPTSRQVCPSRKSAQPVHPSVTPSKQPKAAHIHSNTKAQDRTLYAASQQYVNTKARSASAAHGAHSHAASHLAALQAQGDLHSIVQPADTKQPKWPAQQQLHLALTKTTNSAGQIKATPTSKPARDMFGLTTDDDSSTGSGLGLTLMRPASSLW